MIGVQVTVKVSKDLEAAITEKLDEAADALIPAMVVEAEKIRTASMEIVPVDQGILRASALEVGTQVTKEGHGAEVVIGYGGAAASYALIQHETPPDVFSHTPGRSWKYLERPSLEAVDSVAAAMAEALTRAFSGQGAIGEGPTFELGPEPGDAPS